MEPEWKINDVEPPNVREDNELELFNITRNMELQKVYNKLLDKRVSMIEKEIIAKEILEILDDSIQNIFSGGLLDDWDIHEF